MARPSLDTNVPGHVRVQVASRQTGLTIRDLYELIDSGDLPAVRDETGMVVVPEQSLAALRQD